jgi:hypothetical protein
MEAGFFFVGDLLGFSRIMENLAVEARDRRVVEWTTLVAEAASAADVARYQLLSDTVFAAAGGEQGELSRLVRFAQRLLDVGLSQSFPVRGAISFGEYNWGDLVYGPAVVAAYNLEKAQEWIGVSCDSGVPVSPGMWSQRSLICYPPPLKSGQIRLHPVVAWKVPHSSALIAAVTKGGLVAPGEILTQEWAVKVGNTLQFGMYQHIADKEGFPAERFRGLIGLQVIESVVEGTLQPPAAGPRVG